MVCGCQELEQPFDHSASLMSEQPILQEGRYPLIGGTSRPQTLNLDESINFHFGWIYPAGSPQEVTCSGVLISSVYFLTAAHCLVPYYTRFFEIGFGPSPGQEQGRVIRQQAQLALQHPTLDLALIRLEYYPFESIMPLPLLPSTWDEFLFPALSIFGADEVLFESMGYGSGEEKTFKERSFLALSRQTVEAEQVQVQSTIQGGLCAGDGGGPVFWQPPSDEPPYLVGIVSNDSLNCQGSHRFTRMDVARDWIDQVLNRERPVACNLGSLYCDGIFLHSCPFGREAISECPQVLLCDEAEEHLVTHSTFDDQTIARLRQIDECNRERPDGFWNSEYRPIPSEGEMNRIPIGNFEVPPRNLENMEMSSQGCVLSRTHSSYSAHVWIWIVLLGIFGLKHSSFTV